MCLTNGKINSVCLVNEHTAVEVSTRRFEILDIGWSRRSRGRCLLVQRDSPHWYWLRGCFFQTGGSTRWPALTPSQTGATTGWQLKATAFMFAVARLASIFKTVGKTKRGTIFFLKKGDCTSLSLRWSPATSRPASQAVCSHECSVLKTIWYLGRSSVTNFHLTLFHLFCSWNWFRAKCNKRYIIKIVRPQSRKRLGLKVTPCYISLNW